MSDRWIVASTPALLVVLATACADQPPSGVRAAIEHAGSNAQEIERAWNESPPEHREGMAFLLEHMPPHDLTTLPATMLLENVDLAYTAYEAAPWRDDIPKEIFLNDIIPYAFVTEERAPWRAELVSRCRDIVADAVTPSEAAVRLNQELFPAVGVTYSTDRSRTDQNVRQVLDEGIATCTGLSVLLASACRAVGVPARLAGTPMWPDSSGNHTWVEIWDGEWHFTGAAEPTDDDLDRAWFVERAGTCLEEVPVHAIYATSYAPTGTVFPVIWDSTATYVWGVNVTGRYAR